MSIFFQQGAFSQEFLCELEHNPVLVVRSMSTVPTHFTMDTLSLPFADDFSYHGVYPDNTKWVDKDAYVNRHYPINPPSIGVATLDGLRSDGRPYSPVPNSYGPADQLTSKPLYLGGFIPGDSIYLSFVYQPQGRGDFPNPEDSLLVEFKKPNGEWVTVLAIPGAMQHPFQIVMLPIVDAAYFFDGFQFRFRNYATLSGNNDHWHIDYVYLAANRNWADTAFSDVTVAQIPFTLLNTYTSVPWQHYRNTYLNKAHTITIRNLFNVMKSVPSYYYRSVHLPSLSIVDYSDPAGTNINPFSSLVISPPFEIDSLPSYNADSVVIRTIYVINPSVDINNENDSVYFDQVFYNYYAYDDGTAEMAYGLWGAGAKLAYRFTLSQPDTLRGVYIHFAQMNADVSNKLFSLMVWQAIDENNSGVGDIVLYQKDFQKPTYVDTLNGFYFYGIDYPIAVSGTIYIGWMQTTPDMLNIGFDVNTNSSANIFYYSGEKWNNTMFQGSLMIRPVLGKWLPMMSVEEMQEPSVAIKVYPNPNNGIFWLEIGEYDWEKEAEVVVFDILGQVVYTSQLVSDVLYLNVSHLPAGLYLLRLMAKEKRIIFTHPFIIANK